MGGAEAQAQTYTMPLWGSCLHYPKHWTLHSRQPPGQCWRMESSGIQCLPLPSNRAMAHYDCEIKAVLGQAVIFLKNTEERDNIIAILILTEVRLSPATLALLLTVSFAP